MELKKEDYIYGRSERIPFLKKPYLYRRVSNKVKDTDYLYIKRHDRTIYTDVVHVFEFDKQKEDFVHAPIYTDKYRSTIRKESPKYEQQDLERYEGKRNFHKFIEELKKQKEEQDKENEFIGMPEISDLKEVTN